MNIRKLLSKSSNPDKQSAKTRRKLVAKRRKVPSVAIRIDPNGSIFDQARRCL